MSCIAQSITPQLSFKMCALFYLAVQSLLYLSIDIYYFHASPSS